MDLWKILPETMQTFVVSILGLYIVVNPSGVSSVFVSLTKRLTRGERRAIALRAVITGSLILMLFAVTGTLLFDLTHITAAALQIAGGIFIFGVAFALARGKEGEFFGALDDETATSAPTSIAYSPLAVPLMAGPASITVVVTASTKAANDPYAWAALLISIVVVTALCLFSMLRILHLSEKRGPGLTLVLPRIMALVLAVIAVQFIIEGLVLVLPRFAAALSAGGA